MLRVIARTVWGAAVVAAMALLALPAAAETLFHRAENQVPVAMVQVVRTADYTEVHLQTQAALKRVCWNSTGPNSPYLLADGRRYRYLSGENITACPTQRPYGDKDVMVLRFEPLASQARAFSLVEGQGGENQMIDPKSSGTQYWNFLRIKLN